MRFIHLSLIGYKCLFMNVNYKGQNLLFFFFSLRLTRDDCKRSMNVRVSRPSVAYWKYCSLPERPTNEIKGSRSDFATRWQSLESSSVILEALERKASVGGASSGAFKIPLRKIDTFYILFFFPFVGDLWICVYLFVPIQRGPRA